MTTRNTLTDREQSGSRKAAFDAALTGKTAKLRMMEQLGNARSIDDVEVSPKVNQCDPIKAYTYVTSLQVPFSGAHVSLPLQMRALVTPFYKGSHPGTIHLLSSSPQSVSTHGGQL